MGDIEDLLTTATIDNDPDLVMGILEDPRFNPKIDAYAALTIAAGSGYLTILKLLVKHGVSLKNTLALEYAARSGHTKVVDYLLKSKQFDEEDIEEALDEAESRGWSDIAQMLSEYLS